MKMTLRWYGTGHDTVTLKQIRQIPGVTGVITTLYDTVPGEAWEMEDILALKKEIEDAKTEFEAYVVKDGELKPFTLKMGELTDDEREIILKGCLINYNRK